MLTKITEAIKLCTSRLAPEATLGIKYSTCPFTLVFVYFLNQNRVQKFFGDE